MARRILYCLNPAAAGGRAPARWQQLEPQLRRRGLTGRVVRSSAPGRLASESADLIREHEVVVAVGGDGMAGEVAHALRTIGSPNACLAILPLGSGNDAARMAGVHRLDQALAALAAGPPRAFDTLSVECQSGERSVRVTALVVAGSGLAADILVHAPPTLKRRLGGRLAYVAGFFLALRAYRPSPMTVRVRDQVVTQSLAATVVANHTHAGGNSMNIGPGGAPDDGEFELTRIAGLGRLAAARQFLRLVRGTHIGHPAVSYERGTEVELTSPVPVPVQADGEVLGHTPAHIRIEPRSIRILTPP